MSSRCGLAPLQSRHWMWFEGSLETPPTSGPNESTKNYSKRYLSWACWKSAVLLCTSAGVREEKLSALWMSMCYLLNMLWISRYAGQWFKVFPCVSVDMEISTSFIHPQAFILCFLYMQMQNKKHRKVSCFCWIISGKTANPLYIKFKNIWNLVFLRKLSFRFSLTFPIHRDTHVEMG